MCYIPATDFIIIIKYSQSVVGNALEFSWKWNKRRRIHTNNQQRAKCYIEKKSLLNKIFTTNVLYCINWIYLCVSFFFLHPSYVSFFLKKVNLIFPWNVFVHIGFFVVRISLLPLSFFLFICIWEIWITFVANVQRFNVSIKIQCE